MLWILNKDAESQGGSDGFWYDLTDGGYIKPELLLKDKGQLKALLEAVELVKSFERSLEESDLLNEF